MRRLTSSEVHDLKVAELGLDNTALDLASIEAISCALRRVASFLCPCTSSTLAANVVRPLRGLTDSPGNLKSLVEETLEALISHGDILETAPVDQNSERGTAVLLYALPPSFVTRTSGAVILLGVASDQLSALPHELEARIEYINYVRRLNSVPGENLRGLLREFGLIELTYEAWLRLPPVESPTQHIARYDQMLDCAPPSREVPGLSILDPERSVGFYRGRWVEPRFHSGRFVARRSQAYGANLWCYIQLHDGQPEKLVDLPLMIGKSRACDEAWRLQMAIDSYRGRPQRFRVREGPGNSHIIELFSPLPMWARRKWNAIGEPVLSTGSLFAYRFASSEIEEELYFARDRLWLQGLNLNVD